MTEIGSQKSEVGNPWSVVGKAIIGLALSAMLFALCVSARAQQTKKARIGILSQSSASFLSNQLEAFRHDLRELGYVEGKNLVIEYRYAEGKLDHLPGLADELARLKVDVIVASSTPSVLAAKKATREIPIVFETLGDPVASGLVAGLARPGGNVTGLTMGSGADLYGKRLELLKETVPKLTRAAILWNPTNTTAQLNIEEMQATAHALNLRMAERQGYRSGIRRRNAGKNRCDDNHAERPDHDVSKPDCRACDKASAAADLPATGMA